MKCVEVYKELYHQEPYGVAFCPYRISPLGAHIDHQYGKINGLAINKGIHMAYHPKHNGVVELQSLNFPKRAQFFVNAVPEEKEGDWADHLRGAAKMLSEKYRLKVGLSGIKKIKYMIALIVGAFVLYFAGFFNILLGRLSTEEFSTGRFGAWQTLFSMKVMKFNLFYGIGDDFFEYIHRFVDFGTAGIATEFPILCLLFKVGVIGFIAYIALMLLIPGYELLRKKNLYGAGCIGAYFFLIATYNGLTAYPDTQIVYIIVVLLIELISKVAKKKYTLNEWKVEIE